MKMVVAVVRDEYAATLTERLSKAGLGVTKLASTGGFMKAGSTTFLIGTTAEGVDETLATIRSICTPKRPGPEGAGATVFVLGVHSMVKM